MKIYTSIAFNKYGVRLCKMAHDMNVNRGKGAATIGFNTSLTTRQAEAAINAWSAVLADFHVGDEIHALGEQWVLERHGSRCPIRRKAI